MNNIRRGWCPSLYHPMETGDGWLCRVKPPFAKLTSRQARFIARSASDLGNGFINLSQKANLQLRGFTREHIQQFIPLAKNENLCSPDALEEGKRNILISPLAGIDPSCHQDTIRYAQYIQHKIIENETVKFLTGKFSFVIDGGGLFPLTRHHADINLRIHHDQWILQLGHAKQVIPCNLDNCAKLLKQILQFCNKHNYFRLLHQDYADQFIRENSCSKQSYTYPTSIEKLSIGQFPHGYHLGIPFGLLHSQDLSLLADISDQYGNSTLQLTPDRTIILPYCSNAAHTHLKSFITDKQDPRLNIILCPGKPYCLQGMQPVMKDVKKLMRFWHSKLQTLHISGCAKGCASPLKNPLTLCATPKGYNFILHGRANDESLYKNLDLEEISAKLITYSEMK